MSYRVIADGHVSSPRGFRATGISSGLKETKARDLALIYSVRPACAAAIFTTSALPAAPVFFNQAILARNHTGIRAILINAGHANAGTGPAGLANAVECAKITAAELEIPRDGVLLMSTGRIGVPLPMDRMKQGIRRAVSELDSGGGRRAALAILTTDTRPKERALLVSLGQSHHVILGGMAKSGRMSHPYLATLLCVLTTDLAIDAALLSRSLDHSVRQSFARLVLGDDASPTDGIMILANGAAEGQPITDPDSPEYKVWQEALDSICADLAQQLVRDAVMSGKFVQVQVRNAPDEASACQIARAVARSAAVRWACAHAVPEWSGMFVAVGASGVSVRPDLLELRLGQVTVMRGGVALPFDPMAAVQALSGSEIELTVDLHTGLHSAIAWTCTTTETY